MKTALFSLTLHKKTLYFLEQLYEIAQKEQIEVVLFKSFKEQIKDKTNIDISNIQTFDSYESLKALEPNSFITLGGDGTILSAVTYVQDLQIPIIGINTGRMGFLASINSKEFLVKINEFICNKFIRSKRTALQLITPDFNDCNIALNDITISRKATTSMITVETYVDGEFLNSFWADGLIISTPTGSTGYSLSTGGPIISPENNSIVITPIAPHNLNVRPLTIEDDKELKMKVKSRVSEFSISMDSRLYHSSTDQEIIIKKAPYPIILGQSTDYSFYRTLREKLNWGFDLRN